MLPAFDRVKPQPTADLSRNQREGRVTSASVRARMACPWVRKINADDGLVKRGPRIDYWAKAKWGTSTKQRSVSPEGWQKKTRRIYQCRDPETRDDRAAQYTSRILWVERHREKKEIYIHPLKRTGRIAWLSGRPFWGVFITQRAYLDTWKQFPSVNRVK